jgi:hypothetical protein
MTTDTTERKERKIINLDELIPDVQYVILDGTQHAVNPASVEMYLTVMRKRAKMKEADTDLEQIQQAVELITLACPTIPRERLLQLPLRALEAVTDIIEEQMAGEAEADGKNSPEPNTDAGE